MAKNIEPYIRDQAVEYDRQQEAEAAAAEPSTASGLIGELIGAFVLILLGNGVVCLAVIFGEKTGTTLFEVAKRLGTVKSTYDPARKVN